MVGGWMERESGEERAKWIEQAGCPAGFNGKAARGAEQSAAGVSSGEFLDRLATGDGVCVDVDWRRTGAEGEDRQYRVDRSRGFVRADIPLCASRKP